METNVQTFRQLKLDYVKLTDVNMQRDLRHEIYEQYKNVKSKDRDEVKEIIYPVLRDFISECLETRDYEGTIESFDQIKNTSRYANEANANKTIIKNLLIKAYLFWFLENNKVQEELYDKACSLLDEVSNYLENIHDFTDETQYLSEKKNYLENSAIRRSIENDTFWVEISFTLPFPLGISREGVPLYIDETNVFIETEKIKSDSSLIENIGGVTELMFDKYGLVTRTNVKLKINKYLSEKSRKVYFFGETEYRSDLLITALKYTNEIISRYRITNQNYWVENVDLRMINLNAIKYLAGDVVVREILVQSENTYRLSNEYEYNSQTENEKISELMIKDDNELLWEELLADAKTYLLVNKLREAIIALNSSFENFLYTTFKKVLTIYENPESVRDFFDGEFQYSNFRGREIIDEDTFMKLKDRGVFPKSVPSIYQVIKRYYSVVPKDSQIPRSKKKMLKSIDKIRKHRNDIVHGNLHITLDDKHVYEAIQECIQLNNTILSQHFKES